MFKKYKTKFDNAVKDKGLFFALGNLFKIRSYLIIFRDFRNAYLKIPDASTIIKLEFPEIASIPSIRVKSSTPRLNIVLQAITHETLFGGVATSLILATLYANRIGCPLRVIPLQSGSNPKNYQNFLHTMKLDKPKQFEIVNTGSDVQNVVGFSALPVSEKDIFLSTSWWSSITVKALNQRSSFFYLLQEVESMFYPHSSRHVLCDDITKDEQVRLLINTKLLYDYLHEQKAYEVDKKGVFFEPAFPQNLYSADKKSFDKKNKRRLFFYARPHHPRNIFHIGLKILNDAFTTGILNPNEWEVVMAGSAEIPKFKFDNGVQPINFGNMSWDAYGNFLKSVDLTLSLMYTPHPSYPPLDALASGSVVLTNQYANKQNLPYSKNVICKSLDLDSMREGFSEALHIINSPEIRKANYSIQLLAHNWADTFESTFKFMDKHL